MTTNDYRCSRLSYGFHIVAPEIVGRKKEGGEGSILTE
jgi:hypothetical protein